MNLKKGGMGFDVLMLGLVRMFEYVIAFFILYAIVSLLIIHKIDMGKTEGQVFANRILYSAAAYVDSETGRVYPGILDPQKIDSTYLDSRINGNARAAVHIKAGKEATYNEKYYMYLLPLAQSKIPGRSATLTTIELTLLAADSSKHLQYTNITAVNPS